MTTPATEPTEQMSGLESAVVRAERLPWAVLYRIPIGYCLLPISTTLFGSRGHGWRLLICFVAVLAGLRILPGFVRRVIRFSSPAKSIWAERRVWAKRYDSYQWRKLLGLGIGMIVYLVLAQDGHPTAVWLAAGCVIGGAAGLGLWLRQEPQLLKSSPLA